jgi:hypothetical protein
MNRHLPKTFVVSLVSFALLYYSVAWAVLRCSHEEEHGHHQVGLYNADAHATGSPVASPNYVQAHLDCVAPDYHTELLAGPSSPSQVQRWATHINSHVTDFLSSLSLAEAWAPDLWLRTAFEKPSRLISLVDSPLYLSLSILRV